MDAPSDLQDLQLGLLDLSVDLSTPEVYAGTDFTLYLHIKNPFGKPAWIRSVELSLPTQLSWKPVTQKLVREKTASEIEELEKRIKSRQEQISDLQEKTVNLGEDDNLSREKIDISIAKLQAANRGDEAIRASLLGAMVVSASDESSIHIAGIRAQSAYFSAAGGSSIHLTDVQSVTEKERVPLVGSLPAGAALQPGSTDVWTIRLGSSRSPFFVPAIFKLQLTVIYGLTAPPNDLTLAKNANDTSERLNGGETLYANTVSAKVTVKASLQSVILGGVTGGLVGSIGRSLQDAKTISILINSHLGTSIGAAALALILSAAAIVFAARKSDAQSFVTVEDFWGGLLVGFLIGYSGTAAFSGIVGAHS